MDNASEGMLRRAVHLENVLAALFLHKRLALLVFVTVFTLIASISLAIPKQYSSTLKLLVKSERPDLAVSPDAQPVGPSRSEVTESQVNSEIELLTTDEVLTEVVRRCHLASLSAVDQERAVRELRKKIRIAPARKADIIDISYSAGSPNQAASVLRELVNAYLEAHLRVHRSAGTQEFFRMQTEKYWADLKAYETRLNDFRRVNNLVSVKDQKELIARKLLEVEGNWYESDTAWREAESKVKNIESQLSQQPERIVTQSRVTPNQYSVERLNTMLAELQNRRSQLGMKFKSNDRMLDEVDGEIENTRAALEKASKITATEQVTDLNPVYTSLSRDLYAAQLEREALAIRRATLGAEAADYRNRLAALEAETTEYDNLERGVKESEENYLLYARKLEDARIADSLDKQKAANVSVAEAPAEHVLPTSPNTKLNLLLGFLLAFLCSFATAFGIELVRGVLHTPAQVENETGVPVLATIAWTGA